jgi:hypothetical protein
MVSHIAQVEVLPPAIAGVEDLAQVGQDIDDLAVAGKRRVPEVVDGATFLIGLDDPLSYGGERISRFEVRGHQKSLVEHPNPTPRAPDSSRARVRSVDVLDPLS